MIKIKTGQLIYTEKSAGTETTKTDYIWAETTLWFEVEDGEVYYHHTDHLGTTEAVTDETGKVVWHAEYEAFGSILSENGIRSFTPSFTGKLLDECSLLYYFNARWYDSEMGRFTTQAPARDGGNWYGYCNNSPLNYTDPTGLAYYGPDGVHSSSETPTPHIETNKNTSIGTEIVIKSYTPQEQQIKIDSVSGSLIPSANYEQKL